MINWVEIIAYIIMIIISGESKTKAVKKAAKHFGISAESIWSHGGF